SRLESVATGNQRLHLDHTARMANNSGFWPRARHEARSLWNSISDRGPQYGQQISSIAAGLSMGYGRGGLVDHRTVAESVEPERRIRRVWFTLGNRPCEEVS